MGMNFTRINDAAALEPVMVFGPFEQERESRNIVRRLMQSGSVRVTYVPAGHRSGEFQLLFESYADAADAAGFFAVASLFQFNGPTDDDTAGAYTVVDGLIVLTVTAADSGYSLLFAVDAGSIGITQNNDVDMWELRVPYQEVPE